MLQATLLIELYYGNPGKGIPYPLLKFTSKFTCPYFCFVFVSFDFPESLQVSRASCLFTPRYLCGCCSVVSHVRLFATPGTAACQASLSFTISHSLLKFISTESVTLSNHLILYCPFLFFPSIFLSIKVFSNESGLHIRWAKFWNFSFSPSSEFSGLISFRIDWFDFLAIQGTLKSLLQHHNSKASFFRAQPSLWSNSHIQT